MLPLLKGVSRSFYLSIRLLPAPLRQPIAVAYLLARATDTIADTAQLPIAVRQHHLQTLADAIDGDADAAQACPAIASAFAARQDDHAEQALILALGQCLAWLGTLRVDDQADVRSVLRTITQGQLLDVQRFGNAHQLYALPDAHALRDYTYLVAGCVGEFWTHLCWRHLRGFATLPLETMLLLGRRYGMALQLINILRDTPADLAAGRCYLPADEIAALGLTPSQVAAQPTLLGPIARRWQDEAAGLLDDGMRYADAVNSRRVRAASALPALLGVRTLALLRAAGEAAPGASEATTSKIKVTRGEVRAILWRLVCGGAGRGPLAALYQQLRGQIDPAGNGTIPP